MASMFTVVTGSTVCGLTEKARQNIKYMKIFKRIRLR
jgi:hypothetical protein